MTTRHQAEQSTSERAAAAVRELARLQPFTVHAFHSRLQRYCARRIELRASATVSGDLLGFWFRTAAADYMCYPSQTSPFHQRCILLHLAARMLMSDGPGVKIDPRIVPHLSPELIRLVLGDDAEISADGDGEAEAMVFAAMKHVHRWPPGRMARRLLGQLWPLHAALLETVPQAGHGAMPEREGPRMRLHQMVAEIRDAEMALRPFVDPQLAAAGEAARLAGLATDALAAAVEAAVIADALRAKAARTPLRYIGWIPEWRHAPSPDLRSEAAWLAKVSRAFARDPRASAGRADVASRGLPEGVAVLADRTGRGRVRGDWTSS